MPGGGAVPIYSDITERKRAEAEIPAARDAAEAALERQTATAEILQAISPVANRRPAGARRGGQGGRALLRRYRRRHLLREGDGAVFAAHEGPLSS